jgi:molybdate transport system substrate-binding protein
MSVLTLTRRVLIVLSAFVGVATASGAQEARPAPQTAQGQKPVLFFAAASLQTALNAIAAEWEKQTSKKVTFSYGSSPALARQLEQGAPVDLFASADQDWMDWAEQKKLIKSDTRKSLLGNTLVLVTQKETVVDLKIASGFALAAAIGGSRIATADPQYVPAGKYAKSSLTALGVWDQVAPRVAGTENVRAALALVARGEARFGIVYRTDANAEPRVRVVDTFPANTHPAIVYPFAVTANSSNPDVAAFLAYLSSPAAVKLFEAEGFAILK